MRISLSIVTIIFAHLVFAQLTMRPLEYQRNHELEGSPRSSYATIEKNTLPFWDDFSITADGLPDSIKVWESDTTRQWNLDSTMTYGVYVNSTLAINPPSYRVITFDGIDSKGQFYGDEFGPTDQLTSDTLALAAYDESDEIYLSFYWQAGGNVESPEERDSLTLEFYSTVENDWKRVWSVNGADAPDNTFFYQDTVRFTDEYLSDSAMFRFRSFGDQDGPFDAWHLDYIYIDVDRADDDFYYADQSIRSEIGSLFTPFFAIPTNQLRSNSDFFAGTVAVNASSLERPSSGNVGSPQNYSLLLSESVSSTNLDIVTFGEGAVIPPNLDPFTVDTGLVVEFSGYDLTLLPELDSMVIQSEIFLAENEIEEFLPTDIDRINDTIRTTYLLHDFYAYDDGTAEYAVGTNIVGGQVGVQYWVEEPDTLTHIDIYFPNIAPSSDGRVLTVRIFDDLSSPHPLRSQIITVNTADTLNQFERYQFGIDNDSVFIARPIIVRDTFFVTYEQNIAEYIGIGFDRSNAEASRYIFENIEGDWIRNERLQGALMIRPVFQSGSELVLSTDSNFEPLSVYPNPTDGFLKVKGEYQRIEVRNMLGQLLLVQERVPSHDLSALDTGLYIVSIITDERVVVKKILKR